MAGFKIKVQSTETVLLSRWKSKPFDRDGARLTYLRTKLADLREVLFYIIVDVASYRNAILLQQEVFMSVNLSEKRQRNAIVKS